MEIGKAADRYAALDKVRTPYLTRARACARVTVPSLMPDKGHADDSEFETPHQSLGARGLRTISSKLLMALYPSNVPHFRYQLDDFAVAQIAEDEGTRGDLEKALDSRARAVKTEMENTAFRPVAFEAVRQLGVAGNFLLYIPENPKELPRGYRLNSYVVRRDPSGSVIELVTEEEIAFGVLPPDVREAVQNTTELKEGKKLEAEDSIPLYNHIFLNDDGKYTVYQQAEKVVIPDSEGTYKPENLPYIPLRFTSIDGEDYGRSLIEEILGDLLTLEGLSEAILDASAASARLVFLVNPNGTVDITELEEAENGGFVEGEEGEVVPLQIGKQADLAVAQSVAQDIVERLSLSFMMYHSVQRDAERVTATEFSRLTEELDDALGGVYSLLSVEFQLPVTKLYERRMEKAKNIPSLPKDVDVKPVIVTGVAALGKQREAEVLRSMLQEAATLIPPEKLHTEVNVGEYLKRMAANRGVDTEGLFPDNSQKQGQIDREQLMGMLQEILPQLIQQGGGIMKENVKQQNENERQEQQKQ